MKCTPRKVRSERIGSSPTIHDVAAVAGVSTATVSRVLNKTAVVSEKTKKAVEYALTYYSYAPNVSAIRLASLRKSRLN